MQELTADLKDEYSSLFASMEIDPRRVAEISQIYKRVTSEHALNEYKALEAQLDIPWFVIGIIHNLEASCRFNCHLYNGDPLAARTKHEPKGKPVANPTAGEGQPYSWSESAADAIRSHGLHTVGLQNWDLPTIAYHLELWNGLGYRRYHSWVKSPYLWSFSNVYVRGKYVADGSFSANAVSDQCGGLVLLRYVMDVDDAIKARVATPVPAPPPDGDKDLGIETPYSPDDNGDSDWPNNAPIFDGAYLSRGASGPIIRLLQDRLAAVGASAIGNGSFDNVTELAVRLFQARSVDQRGDPLEIDGIIGPATWRALFGPKSLGETSQPTSPKVGADPQRSKLADAVLDIAHEQLGVMEVPPGSNRGPAVEMFLASVGTSPGIPWCMAFVYWVHKQAAARLGMRLLVPKTASVLDAWARSQYLPEIPVVTRSKALTNPPLVKPGMVFFLDTGGNHGHCGIVLGNTDGILSTIEGNTNNGGSREGVGVFLRRKRTVSASALLGFVDYTQSNQ